MLRFCANVTMLYRELPLLERFAAARQCGFTAVEILSPEDASIKALRAAAIDAGVEVVLCNAPMGDFLQGGPGYSAAPGREAEFRTAIGQARDMAVSLGCPTVHIGPARVPHGVELNTCLDTLARNLEYAATTFRDEGITATIEPLNTLDFPDVVLSRVESAFSVLNAAAQTNAGLQFDVYHMAQMEDDMLSLIERDIDRISHFQFADVPGRREPGSGELDFASFFALIDRLDYEGFLGAEYLPDKPTSESLDWFKDYRDIE